MMTNVEKTIMKNMVAVGLFILGVACMINSVTLFMKANLELFASIASLRPGIIGFVCVIISILVKHLVSFDK